MKKNNLYDIMVDIESWSNLPTAAIASIGAVKFNIKTREICDPFYITVSPKSAKEHGLHFSKETLDWWRTQHPDAFKALRENNVSLPEALTAFREWAGEFGDICCWGMYDIPVLQYAYNRIGEKEFWNFYDTLECRSLAKIANFRIDRSEGVHHNSLQDAKTQAKYLIELLNPEE